jgi:uncharacterized protein
MIGKSVELSLRGHHIGCVLQGLHDGTSHPTVPIATQWLRENPQGMVRLVVGPDSICAPCPHWTGETCGRGFEELNKGKDQRFIAQLGLTPGDSLPAQELFARLCSRCTPAFFAEVCPGCSHQRCGEVAALPVPI